LAQISEKNILVGLTPVQKQAVLATQGPVLIIAGAGSGKTKTLTHRLAYLLSQGVDPHSLVALTFTNKASQEMARRVHTLLADAAKKPPASRQMPFIGTFHSLAARILRKEVKVLGWSPDFIIYDEDDRLAAIKDVMKEAGIAKEKLNPEVAAALISRLKNEMLGPESLTEEKTEFSQLLAFVFQRYESFLLRQNALDFDDLLLKVLAVFKKNQMALAKYQTKIKYLLVDEYQDTNRPQYELVKLLAEKHRNLCVVGDDWQAIYRFRGADFRNILNFQKDWPDAKVFFLEENFRSTQNILDAAHEIISKNHFRTEKHLYTKNEKGAPIFLTRLRNEFEEAEYVAEKILEKTSAGRPLSDFCILFRTNAQSRALEEAFIVREIPYQLIGGYKFYKRKEIQDIVSYLRLIYNQDDILSLKRIINVPPRGVGKITLEKILSGALAINNSKVSHFFDLIKKGRRLAARSSVTGLIKWLLAEIKYKEYLNPETEEGSWRWENVGELLGLARSFDELKPPQGLAEFLQAVALLQEADEYEPTKNKATMMTLHLAKGLEFPIVFIVGCEEKILPHEKSLSDPEGMEEERRLAYVGMTRAKKEVYLTFVHHRLRQGEFEKNLPSRFLTDIPESLMLFIDQEISESDGSEGTIEL